MVGLQFCLGSELCEPALIVVHTLWERVGKSWVIITFRRFKIPGQIQKLNATQSRLAHMVGVHKSTISRELEGIWWKEYGQGGNRGGKQINWRSRDAKKGRMERMKQPPATWKRVDELLREDWSPGQISLWLDENKQISSVMKMLIIKTSSRAETAPIIQK